MTRTISNKAVAGGIPGWQSIGAVSAAVLLRMGSHLDAEGAAPDSVDPVPVNAARLAGNELRPAKGGHHHAW